MSRVGRPTALRIWACVALCALLARVAAAGTPEESLRAVLSDPDYVDVSGFEGVSVDLRYASERNFVHANVYGAFDRPFLRKPAAEKLRSAAHALGRLRPGWRILILDALRPRSVQRLFWARVVGTPRQPYVADPELGSVHNFGLALDATLLDESGREVDMGTGFDDFTPLAEPQREVEFSKAGKLTPDQLDHRQLLRGVMTGAGFLQRPNEWWHYDAVPAEEARRHAILE
jgi:zinc D-Ala-D-Ala dipeptidase